VLKAKSPWASLAEIKRGRVPLKEMLREGRYLNVDLEQRDHVTAFDPDLDLIGIHGNVFADGCENIFSKKGNKVGFAGRSSLMHQQDL